MFGTQEEKDKELNIIAQSKGQLEASINKVEKHLSREDFHDYCDAVYTCIAYIQKIQKDIKITAITTSDNKFIPPSGNDEEPF